ncbi:MAG: hypothetical protein ABSF95_20120 [Verrucomicrobiota bacterium]|jgi:hypothetical protein
MSQLLGVVLNVSQGVVNCAQPSVKRTGSYCYSDGHHAQREDSPPPSRIWVNFHISTFCLPAIEMLLRRDHREGKPFRDDRNSSGRISLLPPKRG